nr:hypothetical protein CFP56_76927 [Quercus suber]
MPQRPTSPTSSLELITPSDGGSMAKGKDKDPMSSFWEDAGVAVLKAHKAISIEDLTPLGVRPSHELMSSHTHKITYVLGKSLYISRMYLDYKEKFGMAQSKVEFLSLENKSLKSQVSTLSNEAKKDKDHWKTLEKSIDTEKAFSKLKDKQINEAFLKIEKVGSEAVEKFKVSDECLDKLCDYYVEGFELFQKYLANHHPNLDFSKLDIEAVEKEILVDHQSTKGVGEGGEVVVVDEVSVVDPSSSNLP